MNQAMRTTIGLKFSQYIINTGKAWVASELGIYAIFKMGKCHTVNHEGWVSVVYLKQIFSCL